MKRFVWNFFIATTVFVFANIVLTNSQHCFAQVEIVDGDGKQVSGSDIPAEVTEEPATGEIPRANPQIFGGGNSIIIRKSFSSVDENGERKTEQSGKAIVIGPDGQRQEFDLGDDRNMQIEIPGFGGMLQKAEADSGINPENDAVAFTLGCRCGSIHPAVASQLGLESGLMVTQVPKNSAAAKAGVQIHDVLLFADDKQLIGQEDLNAAVQAAGEADADVSLTLIRGGKEMSMAVKPEQRKAGALNRVRGFPADLNMDMFNNKIFNRNLDLLDNDMFHQRMEDRMRQQLEKMQLQLRQLER